MHSVVAGKLNSFLKQELFSAHIAKVEGYAEVIMDPDIVEFVITVESVKDKAEDAKNSVSKRVDYLLQTIRNSKLKGDNLASVHYMLSKTNFQFGMIGEVHVKCNDVYKYEEIVNIIVEKLENSVTVSEPYFNHSTKCIQEGRQRALKNAISNARAKIADIAASSSQHPGRAIFVEEIENQISKVKLPPQNLRTSLSMQVLMQSQEVHSRVVAVYELVPGGKFNQNLERLSGTHENS